MSITSITRKSVNMVAELALWIPDTTERQEGYSAVAKATTATTVALDTKARAAQGTVVSTEERTRPISTFQGPKPRFCMRIALKSMSEFGSYAVVDWDAVVRECPHWLEVPQLFKFQDDL